MMGETLSLKTKPEYVQGTTLFVSVINSVWMNELEMQKESILDKIKALGLDFPIEDIRFKISKT
jgi:predicted nucleic acid-binding Zn ribbon protein